MQEYRVRYALHSAYGVRYVHGVIYRTLDEVCDAIKAIENVGYELVGVDSRPIGNYASLNDGWDYPENDEAKNFGFLEIGG